MKLEEILERIKSFNKMIKEEKPKDKNNYTIGSFDSILASIDAPLDEECDDVQLFEKFTGLKFEFVERTENFTELETRFKLDGQIYQIDGYADSYEGYDCGDYLDMYPVEQVEKIIKVWQRKKDAK